MFCIGAAISRKARASVGESEGMLPRKILKFTVSEIAGNAFNFNNPQKI